MATSFAAPLPPVPLLSPTRQSRGSPARRRLSPVLLATSHATSCSREAAERASPMRRRRMVSMHGRGRGGVARIAGGRLVQCRLDAVEPGRLVAERAGEGGETRGTAEAREEQVGGRVVAEGDRRLAELAYAHPCAAGVLLGR